MGTEIPLPANGKVPSVANWACLPAPRRLYVVLYIVLSLVMAVLTVVLPASFYWAYRHSSTRGYDLNVIWLWGRTDVSGNIVPITIDDFLSAPFTIASYIFIIINIIFFVVFRKVKWRYLVLTSNVFLISTWVFFCVLAACSIPFATGLPGVNAVVVLAIALVMSRLFRYIRPTEAEIRDLGLRYKEIGSGVAAHFVNKEDGLVNAQFQKLAEDALACGAHDVVGQANQYKQQLPKIKVLYNTFSGPQPVDLDSLRWMMGMMGMSDANFSMLILSTAKALDAEISGSKVSIKQPINADQLVRTAKSVLDNIAETTSSNTSISPFSWLIFH